MARCCGSTCACKLEGGTRTVITGTGTIADPFIISADIELDVNDNTVFDLTLSGGGTSASPWELDVSYASTAKLDDIPDVNAPAPTNGHVLTYNTATSKWIAAAGTTAPAGAVQHDTSMAGDGSVGTPLQVLEDPARFLTTTGSGLGVNDAGINQLVRGFADAAARTAASPAPDLNTLSMLDSAPGHVDYWTGATWLPVFPGFEIEVIGGELLQISGAYAGSTITMLVKQLSTSTDVSGVFEALTAAELAGRAGVLHATYQPTGVTLPSYHVNVHGNVNKIDATAWRGDTGGTLSSQAITGTVFAWVY